MSYRPSAIHALILALVLLSACAASAQTYVPTQPDNTLTPADPIGVPPQPSTAGTHEAVSDTNGGLSFFLPVLSLPQRGGWNLTLGYYNTSPNWSIRTDSSTQIINQAGGAPTLTNITYTTGILQGAAGGPLNLNLPTLSASIEYAGQNIVQSSQHGSVVVPVVCITNWVFTDWSGNRHSFSNLTECSTISGEPITQVTDSSDGSWLRLDTTNYHSDITVRTKDGTTYHFPGWSTAADPFAACNQPSCYGQYWNGNAPTQATWYSRTFSSLVDSTGQNTITYSNGTLTDTIGRSIAISGSGITYKDSSGTSQTIGVAATTQTQQTYNFSVTCSQGKVYPNLSVGEQYGPLSFQQSPTIYTVTLPAVNGVSRAYTLQFDGMGNLLQVNYPAGGYAKYDYQDFNFFTVANVQTCSRTEHQVAHRRECPLSSGSCSSSQELVTTYTPVPDGTLPFNDSMAVQDPLGNVTYVQNQNQLSYPFTSARETTRKIFPPGQYPNGTPLRTIQTTYTTGVAGVDISIPASVTTALNDTSQSALTNYQYQTVAMSFFCFSNCGGPATVAINNPTETDEYDYATSGTGAALRKTAQAWMTTANGSLYDIAGGHLLDRLATRTTTDPASGAQSTLSYGYNSVGDITSKSVSGTGVSTLTTNYQRDAYGNITQLTDPKGNVTKFGYTDTWAQTTCAPGSNSSAYLTSVTDALNHVTNFAYNSCTGSKASATDPNSAKTSFTYDALGRSTQTNLPDGGRATTTFTDSVPNSVTVSKLVNSSSGLQSQTKTIVDGFSRPVQTQLLSDPDGVTYTDTTYDSLGRKATVSNPYRTSNDPGPTNGVTSYFYDALSRTCVIVPPDGTLPSGGVCPATQPANTVFTTYSGNATTGTDQAGKSRKSVTDALGRLTSVTEDPSVLAYVTNYGYDAFGNLLSVLQNGSRQRNFTYDGFSRLTQAVNPESGTITYAYDSDSNLISKTSPAPNQTGTATVSVAYSYDSLNRLTGKTLSDGTLPATYYFDGQTPPASNSSGSATVAINGSEQTSPATYATGSITISTVSANSESVTVGSHTCTFTLARGTPPANAATAVANCLSQTGVVSAKALSNTVSLTSTTAGTAGNLPLSWSGFTGSISGMSGGANGTPDSGTVSVTVNGASGLTETVSYGATSTGTTIASALATAFNGNSSSPVSASSSGSVLTLTAKATGSTSNYSLSASTTYNTSLFSGPSFPPSPSGYSLTGGCNADSASITNGIGRRTGMCDAAGSAAWTYDSMGRVLIDQRNTNAVTKTTSFTYLPYVDGTLNQLTYPSGRVVTYTLAASGTNTAERLASAADSSNNYATGAHYSPAGSLASLVNGANLASTYIFNSRLQPCWMYSTTGTALPWNSTNCAGTAGAGNVLDLKYNFVDANSHNNGNVAAITNDRDNTRSQNFTYDSLNRLASAQTQTTGVTIPNPNCWGLTFGYDAWGNLLTSTISGPSGCGEPAPLNVTATTANRISGYCYDAAGNLLLQGTCPTGSNPTYTYAYNAENQLTTTAGATYSYDGDGRRVQKSSGKIYWYGAGSDPLDETDLAGNTNNATFNEYIFFGGKRVARRDYQNSVFYYFADHLGTGREQVKAGQTTPCYDADFYPFGGERVVTDTCDSTFKFTGKERDSESGLDNFGARFDSSTLGRWMSPDPHNPIMIRQGMKAGGLPQALADNFFEGFLDDPQNWNKYVYALNNPLRFTDPTGAAPLDGHHLIPNRGNLGALGKAFADAIKTGPLSGNGYPNQPGFNELHRAYNDAVKQLLSTAEEAQGPSEGWSIDQWKSFANDVLKSEEPAITEFLDELEENNPGAKAALATSIATYRLSASVIARVIVSSFFNTARGFLGTLILCVNCNESVTHRFLIPKKKKKDCTHCPSPPPIA